MTQPWQMNWDIDQPTTDVMPWEMDFGKQEPTVMVPAVPASTPKEYRQLVKPTGIQERVAQAGRMAYAGKDESDIVNQIQDDLNAGRQVDPSLLAQYQDVLDLPEPPPEVKTPPPEAPVKPPVEPSPAEQDLAEDYAWLDSPPKFKDPSVSKIVADMAKIWKDPAVDPLQKAQQLDRMREGASRIGEMQIRMAEKEREVLPGIRELMGTEETVAGDVLRTMAGAGTSVMAMGNALVQGLAELPVGVPERAREWLRGNARDLAEQSVNIMEDIGKQGGMPAQVAQEVGQQALTTALRLAALQGTGLMGSKSMVLNAVKMGMFTAATTSGTAAERTMAGVRAATLMATPLIAGKMPTAATAVLLDTALNIGLSNLYGFYDWKDPKVWIPALMMDVAFAASTRPGMGASDRARINSVINRVRNAYVKSVGAEKAIPEIRQAGKRVGMSPAQIDEVVKPIRVELPPVTAKERAAKPPETGLPPLKEAKPPIPSAPAAPVAPQKPQIAPEAGVKPIEAPKPPKAAVEPTKAKVDYSAKPTEIENINRGDKVTWIDPISGKTQTGKYVGRSSISFDYRSVDVRVDASGGRSWSVEVDPKSLAKSPAKPIAKPIVPPPTPPSQIPDKGVSPLPKKGAGEGALPLERASQELTDAIVKIEDKWTAPGVERQSEVERALTRIANKHGIDREELRKQGLWTAEVPPKEGVVPLEQAARELPGVKPIDEIMKQKEVQTRADLEKESTAGFISVFLGKPKQPVGGVKTVTKTLEAGRRYPPGPISKIVDKAQKIGRVFAENFTTFMRRSRTNPQFVDDWRTEAMPMRDRQIRKVMSWRFATQGKVFKHEGRAGLDRTMDMVFTRDLIARGEEGQDLPGGVTVPELKQHLSWLESTASADVKDAANTLRKIFDSQGQSLVQRGKIPATRTEYAPHKVMDYEPEWMKQRLSFPMKSKFGEPYRGYTKKAVGSKAIIRTDEEGVWSHIFKVEMDNVQEDIMLKFANQYDKKADWFGKQKKAGLLTTLRKGQTVEIGGKRYEAIEWKKTFFEAKAVDEPMLKNAIDDDAMVREWVDMRGPKGGKPIKPVVAVGKPKLFLLPEDVAYQLKNMTEKSPDVFNLMYELGRMTQTWKRFTLMTAGAQYHGGNILGDTINTSLFDPAALLYLKPAESVARKIFFSEKVKLNPFEQELHDLSLQKDVATSGQFSGELRKYAGLTDAGNLYDRASGYREALNRLAVLAHQLDRIKSGKPVQRVAGINLKGLDERSAAGKVARDALVDYLAVPRSYTLFLSRGVAPFFRFHEANARNHLRAAFKTPESAAKYWLPTLVAYGSAFAWNNTARNKEDEMALPDWIRNRLHVVYGRNKEGKIRVWAPQQPVDMAWSWAGMDNVSRILSDKKNGKIETWSAAAKELISKAASAPGENLQSLSNPVIQFLRGLDSNTDPFTNRKVMPSAIHKLYKESGFANSLLDKRTRSLVLNYMAEKIVSPMAQYTTVSKGTEYSESHILDLLARNTIGWGRAFGFRTVNPLSGELGEKMTIKMEEQATRAYWKSQVFDVLNAYGNDIKKIQELAKDAPDEIIKAWVSAWPRTLRGQLSVVNYQLRIAKEENARQKLLVERENLIRKIRRMPVDSEEEKTEQ